MRCNRAVNFQETDDIDWLKGNHPEWVDLRTIGAVESTRVVNGKKSIETRYFISSLSTDVKEFAIAVRSHWNVENKLHWVLDVIFREDDCRARKDHSPPHFSIVKHISLNLLKKAQKKLSLNMMREKATWNNTFLENILKS